MCRLAYKLPAIPVIIAASLVHTPLATAQEPTPPVEQTSLCAQIGTELRQSRVEPGPQALVTPQRREDVATAGAGQRIALIDTGVTPGPRLPRLIVGGDFVARTNGLEDCDAHGTALAGVISAVPTESDGLVGIAPGAELISIRQFSRAFGEANAQPGAQDSGIGNARSLSLAIRRAVQLRATIIAIPRAYCSHSSEDANAVALAIDEAFEAGALVIAASGTLDRDPGCISQNIPYDSRYPNQQNWNNIASLSLPAFLDPRVLVVAATDLEGRPITSSLNGPWVDVAAPAVETFSISPEGHTPADGVLSSEGGVSFDGPAMATAYVAGVAALVRAKFTTLGPVDVADRIINTAVTNGPVRDDQVGMGVISSDSALDPVIPQDRTRRDASSEQFAIAEQPRSPAWPGILASIAVGATVSTAFLAFLARRKHTENTVFDD